MNNAPPNCVSIGYDNLYILYYISEFEKVNWAFLRNKSEIIIELDGIWWHYTNYVNKLIYEQIEEMISISKPTCTRGINNIKHLFYLKVFFVIKNSIKIRICEDLIYKKYPIKYFL